MQLGELMARIRLLTRSDVEAVMSEWDQISREVFLAQHRVNPAQKYWIVNRGKTYDAKAILVRALRKLSSDLEDLRATDFKGTEHTIAEPLRQLGFEVVELNREPQYWWVNQNQTYDEEVGGGFMWSPKQNSNGARNQYYENMKAVQPGDIVFSFCDTKIMAIGRVASNAQTQPRPEFRSDSW